MKRFKITQYEIHAQAYEIDADSAEDARDGLLDGESEPSGGESHALDEEEIDRLIEASWDRSNPGLTIGEFLLSIAEIEEIGRNCLTIQI